MDRWIVGSREAADAGGILRLDAGGGDVVDAGQLPMTDALPPEMI